VNSSLLQYSAYVCSNFPTYVLFDCGACGGVGCDCSIFDLLRIYGANILPKAKLEGFFTLVFEALKDKVMLLLICAAIVSIILGALPWTSEDPVCTLSYYYYFCFSCVYILSLGK
jgi:magnesium-transporting ATPase (P-type)